MTAKLLLVPIALALFVLEELIATLRQVRATALRMHSHECAVSCEEWIALLDRERTELAHALYGPADKAT